MVSRQCRNLGLLVVVANLILIDEGDNHAVPSQYIVLRPLITGVLMYLYK